MKTIKALKQAIEADPTLWSLHLMDFVDDFRYYGDIDMLVEPFLLTDEPIDALLASTAETLCDEKQVVPPSWLAAVPACRQPWFVAGIENLKAIALAESPLRFRVRKIFVLENFLQRV